MANVPGHAPCGQAHLAGWFPTIEPGGPEFEPRTTSASNLLEMLSSGTITSEQILNVYYRQILKYNGYLRAVYQLASGAPERAKELDEKRARGESLGSLHGIPVLLKDNVGTEPSLKMTNTGGNLGLVDSIATKNAPIVERLLKAGAIILGKATLSEMMWFKGTGIRCGWSSVHGQSPNPFVKGGIDPTDGLGGHSSPGGSSSGSGIAVAAGFAPMAIGTETEGSLVSPSTRNSLWTVKSALGAIPNEGIMPVSCYLDVPGPMCRTVEDTTLLLDVLRHGGDESSLSNGYQKALKGAEGWKQLRVGTLDPDVFCYDSALQTPVPEAIEQIKSATLEAYAKIQSLAEDCHQKVSLRPAEDFGFEGTNPFIEIMVADFEADLDVYLKDTTGSEITTTKALDAWNNEHARLVLPSEYPNQEFIDRSIAFDRSSNHRQRVTQHVKKIGQSFSDTLEKYNINVIIGPGDSWFSRYSAATGMPLCSLPLNYIDYNGRPIGLMAIAKEESTLLTLMSAFEASVFVRKLPSAFLDYAA